MTVSKNPIFVGGFFKSGTTLLRTLIGQHPNIFGGLESYWFELEWCDKSKSDFRAHVERIRAFYDLTADEIAALVRQSKSAEAFLSGLMALCVVRAGKRRWCEKTPGNIVHVDRLLAAWPDAKFVNIVRHPLDVLTSMYQAGRTDWINRFPENWIEFVGRSERRIHAGELSRVHRVRYEDVASDTEATMKSVIAYLEEPWNDSVSQYAGDDTEYRKVREITGKASTTLSRMRDPLNASRLGIAGRHLPVDLDAQTRRRIADLGYSEEFSRLIEERPAPELNQE
jgi:hypothetical protein